MDCDYIFFKIAEHPLQFSLAISIFILALALFVRIAGNPVSYFINLLKAFAPVALKELRGKAGKAAIINIIIVIFVALLAFLILFKPSIIGLFQEESVNCYIFSIVVLCVSILAFIISLKLVSENEKFMKLYSKTK